MERLQQLDHVGRNAWLDGVLSRANDMATFGSGTAVVSLSGKSPEIMSLTFSDSTGNYTINQGTPADTLHMSNSTSVATISVLGTQTINAPVALDSTTLISVMHSYSTLTLSDSIYGANGLIKSGGGVLILNGTDSYTGGTSIDRGTVQLGNSQALPAGNNLAVNATGLLDLHANSPTVGGLSQLARHRHRHRRRRGPNGQ